MHLACHILRYSVLLLAVIFLLILF